MDIEICTVGGYSEIGANMTAVRVGDEVVIFDMGFHIPSIIRLQEEETSKTDLTREQLINAGAVPDDSVIKKWKGKVKAIVLGHCHLDHIGAVPYLAERYKCPIYGSAYTIEVLKVTTRDDKVSIKQPLKVLNSNSKVKLSENLTLEFVHVTHSTPGTVFAILHTPKGAIIYGNDFKLDNTPTLGKKPNYKRLEEIGKKGVLALIVDALYSNLDIKTPSESVAKTLVNDVLLHTNNKGKLVIVTTFASQIARIKEVIEAAKKMKRKIVVLGRSMNKYITAAENIGLVNFTKDVELVKYGREVRSKLREIQKSPGEYLVICTGNQGEPRAILTRMAFGDLPYKFQGGDHVVYACKTIPAAINIANREVQENKLRQRGVRMFKDIHASGHLAREDHRDLIDLLNPKYLLPCQGDVTRLMPLAELGVEMGYKLGETVFVSRDGHFIMLE
ncbi:RNase J family beta-CASP ribonuclease [archaeon]|jgi:ribonuclease J|nr:RNase J family beta-CASP ribonuclease [archaeon]MBT3730618.1 RNase J family beta-CASP ribonuclease [archaeon]MBT4669520.1 RNase J family beta-CASP ribonuclease [archaeon]MBT5030277.1 RNase J family beta-CASP ribonuclease [archaeon]MBT5288430.1 RNase J family beta-CASP ribonuclease [archaeon]